MGRGRKLLLILVSLVYYGIPSFLTVEHCAAAVVPATSDSDAKTGKQQLVNKDDDLVVASRSTSKDKEVICLAISSVPKSPLDFPPFDVST